MKVAEVKDAAGKTVHVGDIVGGTTSGLYPETVIGPVRRVHRTQVTLEVTNTPPENDRRPKLGDEIRLSLGRIFLVEKRSEW